MTEKEKVLAYLRRQPFEGSKPVVFFTMNPGMNGIISLELPLCERAMGGTGYDVFGVHWTAAAQASHYTPNQAPRYEDIESWREELKFPDVEKFDWASFKKDADAVDRDKFVVATTSFMGPFERTTCLTSFEDCLVNLISEPEDFADLIGAIADYKIAVLEKAFSITQLDVVNLHDDWGTAQSTFMNPDLWRQVIKPHTKRIYDCVMSHGAMVSQHSCGSIAPLVGDMIDMGCTAREKGPLKAKYGDKLIILGGMADPETGGPGGMSAGERAEKPPLPPEKYKAYEQFPSFLFD